MAAHDGWKIDFFLWVVRAHAALMGGTGLRATGDVQSTQGVGAAEVV
jgi:hypothetical protein